MTTVIDKGHSRFGGSSASRWMNCAGSVALLDTVPAKPDGLYAAEGTAAHYVAEQCLKEFLPAAHFLDYLYTKSGTHIVVTGNMIDAVQVYLNEVERERTLSVNAELYVEQGFELDVFNAEPGEVFGTNDAMVYHPETGRLRIFDYKHGVGVSVSAEDNAQLKFYAAGAVFSHPEWRIAEVILTIIQPRARDNESPEDAVRDWTFTVPDLLDFLGDVEEAIRVSKNAAANFSKSNFVTGTWCRWCDAAAVCPAKEAEALAIAGESFADIALVKAADLPQPKELDVERLSAVVAGIGILSAWAAQCQEYLEGLVLSGVEVPGWKAVEKIGRAKWIEDPGKIAGYMEMMFGLEPEQVMPPKLITITEAEKLLKAYGASKDDIDTFKMAHTIKESGGLTLAPASDRRPSVSTAAENFGAAKLGN